MKTYRKPTLIKDLGMKPINSIRKDTGKQANKRYGLFKCYCGKEFEATTSSIINNYQKSCGCYSQNFPSNKTHGDTNTRLYQIWSGIKTRVFNKNRNCSKNYVGRGIKICKEWESDFPAFKKWAELNGYLENLTIERKDNDGHYEPSNCRWATRGEQMQNTRLLISTNTSGYRGVSRVSKGTGWVARIADNNNKVTIGVFENKILAAMAYDRYVFTNNPNRPTNFTLDEVEFLEANKTTLKTWTVEELQEVIKTYREKIKC